MTTNQLLKFILFWRWPQKLFMLFVAFWAATFGVVTPLLQKYFIDQLSGAQITPPISALGSPLILLLLSVIALFLSLNLNQLLAWLGTREAIITQSALGTRLYRHLLQTRSSAIAEKKAGEMVSVYATDISSATVFLDQSLPQFFGILIPFILAPIVLVSFFDLPVDFIFLFLTLSTLTFLVLAFRQSLFFDKFKKLAADRIGVANEWIQNIRYIKALSALEFFEEKIKVIRQIETKNRIRMLNNGQTMNALASSLTFLFNVLLLAWALGDRLQSLSPGTLMGVFWVVAIFLNRPFRQLPWFITFLFDGWTSVKRLSSLFSLQRVPWQFPDELAQNEHSRPAQTRYTVPHGQLALKIQNMQLSVFPKALPFSMKVARGELIGVTGEVGSGKSQFLQALVGEAPCRFEKLQVFDRTIVSEEDFNLVRPFFCLLSQESFLISSSLRDNLNLNYDTTRDLDPWIEESLEKVQFETDQINFPSRLSTEVGERGVNLSGGQKQRLNLARILHKGNTVEQIYLIDDCLNQLDADTSQKVFAEMFQVTLRGFTIFLVSQKPEILKKCDRILFLEDGSVEGFADYDSLSSQSLKFQKLMLMEVHEKNL